MKNIFSVILMMFAILAMVSCDSLNPSERLMVGKWYYSESSMYNDGNKATVESNSLIPQHYYKIFFLST